MLRTGFNTVLNMEGGSEAWIEDGLPTVGTSVAACPIARVAAAGSSLVARSGAEAKMPERISASDLKRMLMDLPGTFEIVDVRPPAMYADFSLPGSINADLVDVITNPAYLSGTVPLIIVDRDGSLAMAAGGILSQKTQRHIKVLYGGLEAYWNDSATPIQQAGTATISIPTIRPAAPRQAPAPPVAPETPKKKSAGC